MIIDSALPQRVSVLLRRIPASLMFDLPHLLPARWRAVQAHAGRRLQRLAFLQVAPGTCAAHNRRAPGYHEVILALPQTCKIWKVLPSVRRPSRAGSPGSQLPKFAESQLPRFAAPPVASTSQSRTRPFQEKVHIDKCAPPEGESSRNIRYTVVIAAAQRVQSFRSPGSARHRRRFQCARPAPIAN